MIDPHEFYQNFLAEQDKFLKEAVMDNATPKIKGEITAGKLRWRGICIIQDHEGKLWVEQRGRPISGKFSLKIGMGR